MKRQRKWDYICLTGRFNKQFCDPYVSAHLSTAISLKIILLYTASSFLFLDITKNIHCEEILIEKHICPHVPQPICHFRELLPTLPPQFFMLISVVGVLYWDPLAGVLEQSSPPWETPTSARPGTDFRAYSIEDISIVRHS